MTASERRENCIFVVELLQHMPVYEVVYGWKKEVHNTNIQMDKGCRTPYDREQCNHYTNVSVARPCHWGWGVGGVVDSWCALYLI